MLSDDIARLAAVLGRGAGKGAGTPESLAETAKTLRTFATRARLVECPRFVLNDGLENAIQVRGGGSPSQQIDWLSTCFADAIQHDGDIYLDADDGLAMARLLHGVADLCRDLETRADDPAPEGRPAGVIDLLAAREARNKGDAP